MPGWACPRMPRPPWSWATTPCCSTRRSPRRAIRSAMARAFALAVEAGRAAYLAQPLEPRDMAVPSTPVIGKAVLGRMTMLDPFYPVVPDSSWVARLVPAGAQLIQLRIKDQPDGRDAPPGEGGQGGLCRSTAPSSSSTTTGRPRSTRAATSSISARRIWSDADVKAIAPRRHAHRRQHARSCRAREGPRRRSRLCGAGPDLSDPAQEDAVGAAGHGAARRMEEA